MIICFMTEFSNNNRLKRHVEFHYPISTTLWTFLHTFTWPVFCPLTLHAHVIECLCSCWKHSILLPTPLYSRWQRSSNIKHHLNTKVRGMKDFQAWGYSVFLQRSRGYNTTWPGTEKCGSPSSEINLGTENVLRRLLRQTASHSTGKCIAKVCYHWFSS